MTEGVIIPNSDDRDEYHDGFDFIRVTLRGYGGDTPIGDSFFKALRVSARDRKRLRAQPGTETGRPALIPLFSGSPVVEGAQPERIYEALMAAAGPAFREAAEWLRSRPAGAFDAWRHEGRAADVELDVGILSGRHGPLEHQPTRLLLPAEFLAECARAGLPIVLRMHGA